MYDLLGSPREDESPAADAVERVLPDFDFNVPAALPWWLVESVAESASSSANGNCWCADMEDSVRRRLKNPDILHHL